MTLFVLITLGVSVITFFAGLTAERVIADRDRKYHQEAYEELRQKYTNAVDERDTAQDELAEAEAERDAMEAFGDEASAERDALRARLTSPTSYRESSRSHLQRCVTCGRRCPHCARGLEIPDA
jgi:septal ring factor EnvC (AmiA/AmiB activator)